MDVAVIGGGIGGLGLALQLDHAGIDCRVYESAPAYAPLGVGINLFPHAVRPLVDLGLEDALRSAAVEQISPTAEEKDSEPARAWRRAHQLKVFLCHASEDKPAVRVLRERLGDRGYRAWIDEKDIPPGADWDVATRDAIRESHIVLVCYPGRP
jgi:flavin-dependent dehydrogenase